MFGDGEWDIRKGFAAGFVCGFLSAIIVIGFIARR